MFIVVTLCLEKVSVIDIFQDSKFVKKNTERWKNGKQEKYENTEDCTYILEGT